MSNARALPSNSYALLSSYRAVVVDNDTTLVMLALILAAGNDSTLVLGQECLCGRQRGMFRF